MDENYDAVFHLPVDKDSPEYFDSQVIKAVSVTERGTVRHVNAGADDETRRIYDELSAVSEEIIKCRNAAILRLA